MIAAIATLRTKEGSSGAEFEAAFGALAAAVRANEPGNKLYQLTRSAEAGVYKVLEIYDSPEAVEAHRAAPHFKELGAALGPFMAGRAEVERLEVV